MIIDRRGDLLAMFPLDVGLGIKEIGLRRAASHEQKDHTLRLGGEMGGSQRRARGCMSEAVKRQTAETAGRVLEKGASSDHEFI